MTRPLESKIAHDGKITVRRIAFEFPDDIEPRWKPDEPEWSYMVNGASLTMPYLEPFLIDSMRDALKDLGDDDAAEVRETAKAFIAQEGQHYRQHRRYNDLLKSKGYPELAEIEDEMQASYDRLRATKSLRYRMGFTAGFESMTLGVTSWLVDQRRDLFRGADSRVSSFILWHMVEETEHKRVAYDVYQAACPGYWMRALGVFTGSLHVLWFARKACVAMLKKDGLWYDLQSRLRLWRRTGQFAAHVLPFLFRSALPGHDPASEADPVWVRNWIDGYARESDGGAIPLVDTSSADMPPPYASAA